MRMRSAVASLTAHTKPKFCDKWPCQRWQRGWGWGAPGARTRGGSRPANIEEEARPLPRSPAPARARAPRAARATRAARTSQAPGHVLPTPPLSPPPIAPPGAERRAGARAAQGQRRCRAGAGQVQDRCRAAELHTPPPHPPPGPPPPAGQPTGPRVTCFCLRTHSSTPSPNWPKCSRIIASVIDLGSCLQVRVRVRVRVRPPPPARSVACACGSAAPWARLARVRPFPRAPPHRRARPATSPSAPRRLSPTARPISQAGAVGTAAVGVPLGQGGCEAGPGSGRVHGGLQRALSQHLAPWRTCPPAGARGRRLRPLYEHAAARDEELDLPLLLRVARERVERHRRIGPPAAALLSRRERLRPLAPGHTSE